MKRGIDQSSCQERKAKPGDTPDEETRQPENKPPTIGFDVP
jgi:hypothetical protein